MARKAPPADGVEIRLREAKDRRGEPLRQSAQRQLKAFQTKVANAPPVVKVKPKKPKSYKTKRSARQEAMARMEINKLVTKEAQRKGDYQFVTTKLQEVVEGGKRVQKESQSVRNLASSVVERWNAKGVFDEREWQAIIRYITMHSMAFGYEQRVTANYSPSIRGGNGSQERGRLQTMDAMMILRLLDNEVFFRERAEHFWVWQNVLIFDEPAGVAGSRCGYSHKGAEAVAREVVKTMAGKVAEILVDQPLPRDFKTMLVDLDAPRRPGRRTA